MSSSPSASQRGATGKSEAERSWRSLPKLLGKLISSCRSLQRPTSRDTVEQTALQTQTCQPSSLSWLHITAVLHEKASVPCWQHKGARHEVPTALFVEAWSAKSCMSSHTLRKPALLSQERAAPPQMLRRPSARLRAQPPRCAIKSLGRRPVSNESTKTVLCSDRQNCQRCCP